ncbi:putative WRKY transcription factor 7 [Abeliophyllum distichum]|uniref:WRKY transcription factor 7 n=1 Tax=Abeliophyllum distichum TaxID=126358 RepID=A0ABD1VUC6_9LAMI
MTCKSERGVHEKKGLNPILRITKVTSLGLFNPPRFRRGPITNSNSNQQKIEKVSDLELLGILQNQPTIPQNVCEVKEKNSLPGRIYCPTPIQRLPPLLHHHQLARNGSIERKESSTTINFASPANSFMSSLTGDTESLQPSMSSGFQITNLSQVSSAGRPPLSTSSFKRKCSSMDDATAKCGGGSSNSRCHCPKKRKSRVKRVVRIPAISMGWGGVGWRRILI